VSSMASLFWLFLLLIGVMYVFAMVLTQGASNFYRPGGAGEQPRHGGDYDVVREFFGSVPRSMYTLFKAMTSGVNWGDPALALQAPGWVYFIIFVIFIFFTFFSVLNIVTGAFVDDAIQHANTDRQTVMQKALKARAHLSQSLLEILLAMDEDGSGFITQDEFDKALDTDAVHNLMASLQLEVHDVENLWTMMDMNGDGVVSIKEFVDGMVKLKEPARTIDIHLILSRVGELLENNTKILSLVAGGSPDSWTAGDLNANEAVGQNSRSEH